MGKIRYCQDCKHIQHYCPLNGSARCSLDDSGKRYLDDQAASCDRYTPKQSTAIGSTDHVRHT